MEKTLTYKPPVVERKESIFHMSALQAAIDLFQEKSYKEAFLQTLDSIQPQTVEKYGNAAKDHFVIPHGSMTIEITLTEDAYTMTVPFVTLGEKNTIAQLRQLLQFNSSMLTLPQIELKNDTGYFYYTAPLELSHPYKIKSLLQQICWLGDKEDDLFVKKFHATIVSDAPKTHYTEDQKKECWDLFHALIEEGREYALYMQTKRYSDLAVMALHTALMKIDIAITPQGYLRSEGFNIVSHAINYSKSPNETLPKIQKMYDDFAAITQEDFFACLYTPTFFISFEDIIDVNTIQTILQKDYDLLKNDIAKNEYAAGTIFGMKILYDLLYRYTLPPKIKTLITEALQKTSDVHWRDSAQTLQNVISDIFAFKTEEIVD